MLLAEEIVDLSLDEILDMGGEIRLYDDNQGFFSFELKLGGTSLSFVDVEYDNPLPLDQMEYTING